MSMNVLTLGAIDIGSNSIRLLISHVIPTPTYTYYKKVADSWYFNALDYRRD